MAAFYLNIGSDFTLKVIPEPRVHMDGHPIVTYCYNLYRGGRLDNAEDVFSQDDNERKQSNPNYLGSITFEIPGRVFNYVADGQESLSRDEVRLAVEQISHYRDNPALWRQGQN